MTTSSASATIKKFNAVALANEETLKKCVFFHKILENAGVHVCREILFLCETINANAEGEDPHKWIKFGKLFNIYSFYSDKLVGMLIRARKYGLVHFEGEMLYQRQDDNKNITMLMSFQEIQEGLSASGDPANCLQMRRNSAPVDFKPPDAEEAPRPRPVRSDSVTSSKKKFEAPQPIQAPPNPSLPAGLNKPKKPWTPKDSSKAPVFCT
uniref:Costars domain-containing protein n=1 Tax=Caenorhabditis japonica TaxID=281687 RepID=A0A8R1I9N8_CAEJA